MKRKIVGNYSPHSHRPSYTLEQHASYHLAILTSYMKNDRDKKMIEIRKAKTEANFHQKIERIAH